MKDNESGTDDVIMALKDAGKVQLDGLIVAMTLRTCSISNTERDRIRDTNFQTADIASLIANTPFTPLFSCWSSF